MKDSNVEELEVLDEIDPLGDVSTPFDDVFKSGIENAIARSFTSSDEKKEPDESNLSNENCSNKFSGLRIRTDLFLKQLQDSFIEEQNKSKLESSIGVPNNKSSSVITIDTSDSIEDKSDKNITKVKSSSSENGADNKIGIVKTLRNVRHSRENSLNGDESDSKSTGSENSSRKKSVSPDREEIVLDDSETSESESEESEEEEEDEDSDEAKEKWEKRNIVEYTEKENKYYNRNKDRFLKQMKGNMTACTACCNNICHYIRSEIYTHPVLGVLVCKKCSKFYGKGDFKKDSDGLDEYCRWCSNGGDLFVCDHCTNGFCKNCIKRNLGRSALKDVTDSKNWECFVCSLKPLLEARTLHRTILEGIRCESSRKSKTPKDQEDDSPKEKRKPIRPDSKKKKNNSIKSDSPKKKNPDSSKKKNSDFPKKKKKDPDSPKEESSTHGEDLRILLITFKNQLKNIESRTKAKGDKESNKKFHRRLVRLIDLMQDNFSQVKKEIIKEFGNIVEDTAFKMPKIKDSDNVSKKEKEKNVDIETKEKKKTIKMNKTEDIEMESIATKIDSEDKNNKTAETKKNVDIETKEKNETIKTNKAEDSEMESIATKIDSEDKNNKTDKTKRKRNIDEDNDDNISRKRMKVQNEDQTPNIETKNDLSGKRRENQEEVPESLKNNIIKDKSSDIDEDDKENSREMDVEKTAEQTESKKSGEDDTFDDSHDKRPISNPSLSKVVSVVNEDEQNHCSTPISKNRTRPSLSESPIIENKKRRRNSSDDREVEKNRRSSKIKYNEKNGGDSEEDDKEESNEKDKGDSEDESEEEKESKKERDSKGKDKKESNKQKGRIAKTDKKVNKEKSRGESRADKAKEKNIEPETDEESLPDLFNLTSDNSKNNDSTNKKKAIKKSDKSEKKLKNAKISESEEEEEEESEQTKTLKTRSLRLSSTRSNSARKSNRKTPVLTIDSDSNSDSDSDSKDSDNSKNKNKKIKPNRSKDAEFSEGNLIKNRRRSTEQSNSKNNKNLRKTRSLPKKDDRKKR